MSEVIARSDAGNGRARMTNGSVVLDGVDTRTSAGRRYRDLLDSFVVRYAIEDEADMALARRAAALALEAERQEARTVAGETGDTGPSLATAANALRRLLSDLDKSRRQRLRERKRA